MPGQGPSKQSRDDYTARRFRVAQTLKPTFMLLDGPSHGLAEIHEAGASVPTVVGQINLNNLRVELDWDRWFEPYDDEALFQRVVDGAWGDGDIEWAARGWEDAFVEIWTVDDDDSIQGFEIRGVYQADTLDGLREAVAWALAPRAPRFDQWHAMEVER
jgi:hypothetical protein